MRKVAAISFYIVVINMIILSCKEIGEKQSESPTYSDETKRQFTIKLCDERQAFEPFVRKYLGNRQYKRIDFDTNFYTVTYSDSLNGFPVNWAFVSRNDTLNQYGFSFNECLSGNECFKQLYAIADSLINAFTFRFGFPVKSIRDTQNFYKNGKRPIFPGNILKAMWTVNGQKIKVDFSVDGEHNEFHYTLRVSRFKNYYGNMELPLWWDGY